ncbi:MAG: CvpA family protein [Ruminococcaceae bacterium]|nr:CvpA family protein [Oscillospiraceae bacterium]
MMLADIVIAAVLVLAVIIGAWKGLVKSLAGVVIVVAAFIGASFVANAFAEPVADWLGPVIEENILDKLAAEDTTDAETMLSAFHFRGESLQQMVDEVMGKVKETGMDLLSAVTDSVAQSVAYAAVYLVAFLALLLVLWLLMKPVHLLVKLPGLRTVNALGGGALGLVWGALLVFFAVWLMQRFDWYITADMVANSTLLHFFATNSPISLITSL